MVLSFLFFAFLAYLVYRLVVGFVLPIYRTTKQVKKSFRDMREKMQDQTDYNTGTTRQTPKQPAPTQAPKSDYIDFEEIKK